ncbi:FAD-dependent oxidoreductase [Streptomyces sp. HU2014]|uniref:Pyridine nucleotide-disulfide oxidoreductase n=1 Tax=Streptomyces albireticuli TaxID=1940 RepID=A0A1Z2L4T4_9ACTN|nr:MULTISPECIES: FAD-dependent oxidoreductase [Streptomyces]ARZ69313.1 pyridine nucleotide-disulfide oxidoreductase [Streptomyces albireticuli]UQI42948.1 FAD-dependent oxidoreductase [Streptomyces sp. HU2014]
MMTHSPHASQVVVLGAGYAGLSAALRLAPYARVTLVDPADRFTERVRLHELAAGRPEVSHPLSAFLRGTGIRHLAARAVELDLAGRQVRTDNGRTLLYDRLVYALGSVTDTRAVGDHAYTAESAAELRKRLQDGPGRLTVVGGGLTGIELAAEIAESNPRWETRLLTAGTLGAGLSPKGRAHVRTTLGAMGVRVEEGRRAASAHDVDADVVVWAAAMRPVTDLAAGAGLALDASGRIAVDHALRSTTDPAVFVAGDAAASSLRMACATAMPTGAHAAAGVLADLRSRPARPLDFRFVVQCLSLGRTDGLIQPVHADDSPRPTALTGRTAARVKEQVVRSTVRVLHLSATRARVLRRAQAGR